MRLAFNKTARTGRIAERSNNIARRLGATHLSAVDASSLLVPDTITVAHYPEGGEDPNLMGLPKAGLRSIFFLLDGLISGYSHDEFCVDRLIQKTIVEYFINYNFQSGIILYSLDDDYAFAVKFDIFSFRLLTELMESPTLPYCLFGFGKNMQMVCQRDVGTAVLIGENADMQVDGRTVEFWNKQFHISLREESRSDGGLVPFLHTLFKNVPDFVESMQPNL